ncbi:hypothetical protein F4778DRAFT_779772 [Xylariomycetidae sp. FL2044]|nr:hypothetical protein F4778DRAFT_779772 [Xylariomycetidae sp. FL2044]
MSSATTSREAATKMALDISNLMSPPEAPKFESFSQSSMAKQTGPAISDMRRFPGPLPPLSPPISPATKTDERVSSVPLLANTPVKDPILYPTQDMTSSPPQQPLFVRDDSVDVQRIIDEHVMARPKELFQKTAPPNREDYGLFLEFSAQIFPLFNRNPKAWLQRERALLLADRRAGAKSNKFRLQPILPAKPQPVRKEAQRPNRTVKAPKVTKQSNSSASRPIRSGPVSNHNPKPARVPSATPDPAPRRAVAPNREDKDFNALPDYCPPRESLPSKPNSLKVDWKGAPIDLSNDGYRHLLHPDEVTLAANLRLDCATYLTSKRRMFVRRLECLRMGKEFRKTDAQQACKIDVNKASKLWTAFDKVGWLEKSWVIAYL